MIGPDGEGGGVRYACERSSHSWLPLFANPPDGEGELVGRLFVPESDGGANRERLNAAGREIERGRFLGFGSPERDRGRDGGTYDGFEVSGGRCGCCSCIPALMGVDGADETDNFESGRRRIEDGSNFPSSVCVIAVSAAAFAPTPPNSPPTIVWYDGGGVRGRNMGNAGEVENVDGEYMLVVRVRKRTGEHDGTSSLVPSSRTTATMVPFASDSTFPSGDVASTVGVKVREWSGLAIDDEHTASLSQSSSPSSSHTGNNHVGLSGTVLVGLSGNDTHDIPGRFSNTKLSGTRFKFSTPYFPCRSSRSCAVKAYRDSGELRNGLPRERPVGTIGPRGIGQGKQRPGGQIGGEFVSWLL